MNCPNCYYRFCQDDSCGDCYAHAKYCGRRAVQQYTSNVYCQCCESLLKVCRGFCKDFSVDWLDLMAKLP